MSKQSHQLVEVTDPETDRYAALRLIDWWDQDLIRASRVMVVGVGALGNEVLKNLALLGVGRLFIADMDQIDASNLTRSVLFRAADAGRPKAEVAAERLRALNPDLKVQPWVGDISSGLGLGVYRRMDLIIGCLDNRAARLEVNRCCRRVKRPWIDGGLDVQDGVVRTFGPEDGVCYECTMTTRDYALAYLRYSCPPGFNVVAGRQPTTPMAASIIAALQVQEAVKFLHGRRVETGTGFYYSAESIRFNRVRYSHRNDCPAHDVYDPVISLQYGPDELKVESFLQLVRQHTGGPGILYLPHETVGALFCGLCDEEDAVFAPYRDVVPARVPCPHCGTNRAISTLTTISERTLIGDMLMSTLGVAPMEILPVRTQNGWCYFELAGNNQHFRRWDE